MQLTHPLPIMRIQATISTMLVAALMSGCGGEGERQKLVQLEQKVSELESANKALYALVESLKLQQDMEGWAEVAFLKPGDEGYSVLKYDLGAITVKIADVKPYANGSKVSLQIGNLASARVDGLKAKLDWGKLDDKGIPQNDKTKSRDVNFNESLAAGAWTTAELVLDAIPPSELGFVRLRQVSHRGISLRR